MEIKYISTEKGYGLFSTTYHKKDSIIHTLVGTESNTPSRESIRVIINGVIKHITDDFGKFINHSFEPSCIIKDGNLVAINDIKPNTELTFDYNDNEVEMAAPFIYNGITVQGKKIDK